MVHARTARPNLPPTEGNLEGEPFGDQRRTEHTPLAAALHRASALLARAERLRVPVCDGVANAEAHAAVSRVSVSVLCA